MVKQEDDPEIFLAGLPEAGDWSVYKGELDTIEITASSEGRLPTRAKVADVLELIRAGMAAGSPSIIFEGSQAETIRELAAVVFEFLSRRSREDLRITVRISHDYRVHDGGRIEVFLEDGIRNPAN